MWKANAPSSNSPQAPPHEAGSPPEPAPARAAASLGPAAIIGPSISIKGEISGSEDLVIEGQVEGAVRLHQHNVTVASSGRVTADIRGRRICVDGKVTGDLLGEEVLIRKSGRVQGNAKAPKVTLENGCYFRGSIDMQPRNGDPKRRAATPK